MADREQGVNLPLDSDGKRSTTSINREAFAASMQAVNPDEAAKIRAEKRWRKKYNQYVVKHVEVACANKDNALKMADAGLQYMHGAMRFLSGSDEMSLPEAMAKFTQSSFETGEIVGKGSGCDGYVVPYNGQLLEGNELRTQIDKWVRAGVIETDTGAAMLQTMDTGSWLRNRNDAYVLLGASSAMGPINALLALGATVVAVDIGIPKLWEKLFASVRNSPGRLVFPLKRRQQSYSSDEDMAKEAGCNLLSQAPDIRNWLTHVESSKRLVIGAYAYLDGVMFMRISMAMDAITKDVMSARRDTALAYLATPTDAHVSTAAAQDAAGANLRRAPMWQKLLAPMLKSQGAMRRNQRRPTVSDDDDVHHIVDAIVVEQGPNYILSKRLQHWRAITARAAGHVVSANVAPSTATVSVVHNRQFAWAYGGMPQFKPVEVFQQETSAAVMALLLLHDVNNPLSAAQPTTQLRTPYGLFMHTSFHGGAWRTGYGFGTIGIPSVLAYFVGTVVTNMYLTLYNAVQSVGWIYLLYLAISFLGEGVDATGSLWDAVGPTILMMQKLSLLEVVHSVIGAVKSPAAPAAMQIGVRLMHITAATTSASLQTNVFLQLMVMAWIFAEISRYPLYTFSTNKINVPILTHLRYNLFLILYPLGALAELGMMHTGLPILMEDSFFGALIPNRMVFWALIAPLYPIVVGQLFSHMLAQRRKIYGRGKGKKAKRA